MIYFLQANSLHSCDFWNCNHFTAYMCERLTGRPGPPWLNRAASIGVALPCMVPKEWITPPDYETADGELVDDDQDERARMLGGTRHSMDDGRPDLTDDETEWSCDDNNQARKGKGKDVRDTSGRVVPLSERAPMAKR
ncbi:hypothetical protein DID88_001283 [Monilinia fructigena]|uniref:PPPDE domain-containing protein n=1 Tax=Monilinia fructigena TaxID=38457 RepID=A0A395IY23_9HELO|nr:hypothetical protein DID88_001283 [Monilinia fructigena]